MNVAITPAKPINIFEQTVQQHLDRAESLLARTLDAQGLRAERELFDHIVWSYYLMGACESADVELDSRAADLEDYFSGLCTMYELERKHDPILLTEQNKT